MLFDAYEKKLLVSKAQTILLYVLANFLNQWRSIWELLCQIYCTHTERKRILFEEKIFFIKNAPNIYEA